MRQRADWKATEGQAGFLSRTSTITMSSLSRTHGFSYSVQFPRILTVYRPSESSNYYYGVLHILVHYSSIIVPICTGVFDIEVIFLWEVATNNKRLSLFTSSIHQTSSVKIWAKSIHKFTSYSVWKQTTSEFFPKMEKSEFRVLIKHYLSSQGR